MIPRLRRGIIIAKVLHWASSASDLGVTAHPFLVSAVLASSKSLENAALSVDTSISTATMPRCCNVCLA